MFAIIAIVLMSIIIIINILLICGLPLGEFTLGGKYKKLPKMMRIIAASSLVVQLFSIIILLQMKEYIPLWFSYNVTKGICIFYAVYLSFNVIINAISTSKKERYVMTPLSLLVAICFWLTAFL